LYSYVVPAPLRSVRVANRDSATDENVSMSHNTNHECGGASRRDFLRSVAAVSAAAVIPGGLIAQTASSGAATKPTRIDVHHHVMPSFYLKSERERILPTLDVDPALLETLTPAKSVQEMDKYGVATAIASMPIPGVWFGDVAYGRKLSRDFNEYMAQMVKDYPGRFGMFAALPLPDTEGSLREIEYALDVLHADGVSLLTSYEDKWPGDPAYRPVFEELNRRKAVVYFHPTMPGCCRNLIPGLPPAVMEVLVDTARAIESLLVNGTFSRFPDIRFIFSHAGGTMTVQSSRTAQFFARHKELAERVAPNGVLYELKRLHYEIANSVNPSSMAAVMNMVPVSQLLFGSDFPYAPLGVTATGLDNFALSAGDKQAINRDNAIRLFPRLRAASGE
jgi:predicted TIM-barrel fold metal-dependent hydrolase